MYMSTVPGIQDRPIINTALLNARIREVVMGNSERQKSRESFESLCEQATGLLARARSMRAGEFESLAPGILFAAEQTVATWVERYSGGRDTAWKVMDAVANASPQFQLDAARFAVKFLATVAPQFLFPRIEPDELYQLRNLDAGALKYYVFESLKHGRIRGEKVFAEALGAVCRYGETHPSRKRARPIALALEVMGAQFDPARGIAWMADGTECECSAQVFGYLAATPELRHFLPTGLAGLSPTVLHWALATKVGSFSNIEDESEAATLRWLCEREADDVSANREELRLYPVFELVSGFVRRGFCPLDQNQRRAIERLALCAEKGLSVGTLTGFSARAAKYLSVGLMLGFVDADVCATLDRSLSSHRKLGSEYLDHLVLVADLLLSTIPGAFRLDRRSLVRIYRSNLPWSFELVASGRVPARILHFSELILELGLEHGKLALIDHYCSKLSDALLYDAGCRAEVLEDLRSGAFTDSLRKCFALCDKRISARLTGDARTLCVGLELIPELEIEVV